MSDRGRGDVPDDRGPDGQAELPWAKPDALDATDAAPSPAPVPVPAQLAPASPELAPEPAPEPAPPAAAS
ncbi:MAG TPA: hypothetical protein VN800_02485, partial [Candidatus Acidoferrales bacterium]|nr:hypothetical protein [Candidatus Acidoferrales bacterium]